MRSPDRPEAGAFDTGSGPGRDNLAERLSRLPDNHPSSPRAGQEGLGPDGPDADLEDPGPDEDGPTGPDPDDAPGPDDEPGPDGPPATGTRSASRPATTGGGPRDPFRPWFADGGPAEPWFAADRGGPANPAG